MASLDALFGAAPLWLIGVAFFVALAGASLGGRWMRLRLEPEQPVQASEGYLLSSSLALLGRLIAFTFSLAVGRYDDRREAVIREGNALSTAWLRAGLVDGPAGDRLRSELRLYTDIRASLPDAPDRSRIEARSSAAQVPVWAAVRAALPAVEAPIGASIVAAVNEMFDSASARKAERDARIPGRVLDVVTLYAVISAAIVGYVTGRRTDRRQLYEAQVLFVLLTLALTLILDLDRPWSGAVTVSAQPVEDARAAMR